MQLLRHYSHEKACSWMFMHAYFPIGSCWSVWGLWKCFLVVQFLHWMRACRAVWTGRCHCGSSVCWGNAAWLASCLAPLNDSASCSAQPLLGFVAEVGMGNSLLSQLYDIEKIISAFCTHKGVFIFLYETRFSPTTPEVPPGSVYAPSCTASLVACVTGDKILGRQLRSHVTHGLNRDSVWCHSW